ncbi:hypothetical protein AAG570_007217 [Ranatra chinensis]|uniref:RING-type domain-containing protein n=1 Tax=Ranatra chinensis TaxID=642074 RepID=A0ABD0XV80_9HEMI
MENFGEEVFQCKDVRLGIGPHGINIYHPNPQNLNFFRIPYTAIRSASSLRRLFQLWYLGPDHTELLLEIKCESCLSASGLYRALTEKHAFYSCDTVRGAVTAQYIRDLKGTIVSIFNESSPLGKKYVFDIRRTCREVHDNARRALYEPARSEGESSATEPNAQGASATAGEKLARLMDALSCRICMDAGIDTVLFPCAHVICCHVCAERCTSCPLCRSPIESAKRVYLPTLELGEGETTTA